MVSNHLTKYRYKKGIYGESVEPELNVCIDPNEIDRIREIYFILYFRNDSANVSM